jgi:hypothetical protein
MNQKQMEAAILSYAFLDAARENADYVFTKAEEARFYRALNVVRAKLLKLSLTHYDDEVFTKIYGE